MGSETAGSSLKKILWGVNLFERSPHLDEPVIDVLRNLAEATGTVIQPVSIVQVDEINLPVESFGREAVDRLQHAESSFMATVKNRGLNQIHPLRIITEEHRTITATVRALDRFASQERADVVVVGTHARTGLPRLFLGSFSETLLLTTHVSVMTVGPHPQNRPILHILFLTDFSLKSFSAFEKVVQTARDLHARITLFHALPITPTTFPLWENPLAPSSLLFAERERAALSKAEEWADQARLQDVKTDSFIAPLTSGIVDLAVRFAQENKVGLISLASRTSAIVTTVVGSVARQIVRQANCPVWLVGN